jgi:hypothetical protein
MLYNLYTMPIGEHTPHPHESQPEILSDYAQSTDQLLGLLSTAHNRTHYYTVSWDREVPGRVADITLMRATSTGAHREERFGQFHQAQFAIDEVSLTDGDRAQRLIAWCRTSPHQAGSRVRFNPAGWEGGGDYQEVSAETVIKTLAEQARTTAHEGSYRLCEPPSIPVCTRRATGYCN